MTNRYHVRGTFKEKDSKLDDGSIFKFLSPAVESMPSVDLLTQDKQLMQSSQKTLQLPPLRIKNIRNSKTAASLRGITSSSLKQILKESINFSERLSDVQLMHHHIGGTNGMNDSNGEVAHSMMYESPRFQHPSLMWPATSQPKVIAPIDVKNFQLSIAPTATTGRVGKPSRLIVSNQTGLQNVLQPVAPKPITPLGTSPHGAMRASSRGRKVAIKYFGCDKSEQSDVCPDSGRAEETAVDGPRSQTLLTCLEFKPSSYPHVLESEIRKSTHNDVTQIEPSHFSNYLMQRPLTSNDLDVIASTVLIFPLKIVA
jgi:hypothetical protein